MATKDSCTQSTASLEPQIIDEWRVRSEVVWDLRGHLNRERMRPELEKPGEPPRKRPGHTGKER